jgi:hypothetical protein
MKKVIAYSGSVSPNTTTTENIYTIPTGMRFKIEKLNVVYGTNVDFDLEVALYHGDKQVIPESDTIKGPSGRIPIECDWTWSSGEKIKLYLKNSSSTNTYKYSVILIGDLG